MGDRQLAVSDWMAKGRERVSRGGRMCSVTAHRHDGALARVPRGNAGPSGVSSIRSTMSPWWKIYRLENKYELLAGGLPGEAVACYGDSGGPLLLQGCHGELTTYGVSFAVEHTFSTVCGLGGGYLVFNERMLDFVKDAL
jgi:hypothetical protein